MTDEERDALLQKMDSSIDELKLGNQRVRDAIFDTNGKDGLCTQVEKVCDEVAKHKTSIVRLWAAIAIIVGGSGGTLGLIELIKKL